MIALPPRLRPRGSQRGFTLIEIMIVVVIVSILAGIALPSYLTSMQKGRRGDGKAAILDVVNRQEQFMLDNNTYTADMSDLGFAADPYISQENHYSVDAVACSTGNITNCFIVTATPRSSSPQASDNRCTALKLDSTGAKSATGSHSENCW